jgi:hypothetical protein
MDWQSMIIFSLTLSICFHGVGHVAGYVAHKLKDKALDRMIREISNMDKIVDEYAKVRRVK